MHIKKLPGALVIAALVTLAISLGVATPNVYGGGDDSLPTLPKKARTEVPQPGFQSRPTGRQRPEKGETSAKEAAEDAPARRKPSIAVTIYLSGNVDDVVKFLEGKRQLPTQCG